MSEPVKVVLGPGAKPATAVEVPQPELPELPEPVPDQAPAGKHRLEVDGE